MQSISCASLEFNTHLDQCLFNNIIADGCFLANLMRTILKIDSMQISLLLLES